MKNVLVTGANGQLGRCIQDAAREAEALNFTFATRDMLSITNKSEVEKVFESNTFDYCINTAAYTQVDEAEKESESAFAINAVGARNLAEVCSANNTVLIHVSTDYVFDGTKTEPYKETDNTNPINVYGASKLAGEEYISQCWKKHFIIRTSWLYSQYGKNFFKTIRKHGKLGTPLKITTEQTGTPTNANDLASALLKVISTASTNFGTYHFSNSGSATWFDFAEAILVQSTDLCASNLAKTDHYRTFAKRPEYSVLDLSKITETFQIAPKDWRFSLEELIHILENN